MPVLGSDYAVIPLLIVAGLLLTAFVFDLNRCRRLAKDLENLNHRALAFLATF